MSGERKEAGGSREGVKVICRVRPPNKSEIASGKECVKLTNTSIEVRSIETQGGPFFFDRVFGPTSTQKEVFDEVIVPIVKEVLGGYNATVFAYGQSGSGKTHTMEGSKTDPSLAGVIPRAANAIFEGVLSADENIEFMLCASFVEIYMEKIRDLLDMVGMNTNLQVREDPVKGIYVEGATEEYVTSANELLDLMTQGSKNRATAATGLNEGSSRSHSLFNVTISQRDLRNNSTITGKLFLCDLAGSETAKKTGASGQQMEEAKMINKSLSALGLVINALTDSKATHVPYRDSKLTRILQNSLGGNSKTVLIISCSPSSFNATETVSTLRFGTRAKSIQNKVVMNKTRSVEELEALLARSEKAIDAMATHITSLTTQLQLAQLGGGGGVAVMPATDGGEDNPQALSLIAQLQEKVADLELQLVDEKEEASRRDEEVGALKELLVNKERVLQESDALMQEAQAHIEEKRIHTDKVIKEKTELASHLEEIQSKMELEYSKSNFAVKELQVTVDTLRKENSHLQAELKEYAGEKRSVMGDNDDRSEKAVSTTSERDSASYKGFALEGIELHFGGDMENLSKNLGLMQERVLEHKKQAEVFKRDVMSASDNGTVTQLVESQSEEQRLRADELLVFISQFQKATEEHEKRYKELQQQRDLLERDLSLVTKKAQRSQNELEMVQKLGDEGAARFFEDKNKVALKSLQHRLEQLVAVHRQLLRKYASLDLENSDLKKKISLRDERIASLEMANRIAATTLRQQTDNHIAELSSLREQLQTFRQDGGGRRESLVLASHSGARQTLRGGNGTEKTAKTLRGGGQMDEEVSDPAKKKSFFSKIIGGSVR